MGLIVVGALLVLAFSPVTRLAADGLPREPGNFAAVVTVPRYGNTTAIRVVPAGLPNNARIRTAADVLPYAVAALGKPNAAALMALVDSHSYLTDTVVGDGSKYPFRYPPLDAVLDKAPPASFTLGATALGAALTVLAAQPESSTNALGSNASAAAYGVLNRARAAGGCAPQLDLLLLLAADQYPADQATTYAGIVGQEERRTEEGCPHDPTPAWLVG